MSYQLCRHIKTNGKACNSPALTGQPFCYFHQKLRRRHRKLAAPTPLPPAETVQEFVLDSNGRPAPQLLPAVPSSPALADDDLDLPLLEDRESVQVAISLVVSAIAHRRIEPRRAAAILYGLQLASNNTPHLVTEPNPSTLSPTIARGTSGFDLVPKHLSTPAPSVRCPDPAPSTPADHTPGGTVGV